jgi:hypothetical protein
MFAKDYVLQLLPFECAKGYLFRGNNHLQLVPYHPGNNLSPQSFRDVEFIAICYNGCSRCNFIQTNWEIFLP